MSAHLPPETIQAYRDTRYEVIGPPRFDLWVDRYSVPMHELLELTRVDSAALVTAFNPRSLRLGERENSERHELLRSELSDGPHAVFSAQNVDPAGRWPVEPGFLIVGVSRVEVVSIARRYEQSAVLFIGQDAVPCLEWVDGPLEGQD